MNADCVHTDVVYGAKVNLIDQNDLPVDQEPETYTGLLEDWKRRWYEHGRSFREPGLRTETALSEYIWELKEEDQRYSISWHIIERTQSFNPITLQCKLCLSEIVNMLLLNPTQASLNKKSECYQFCRHRKKFLLAYSKPLALKGGALTYRYKR